MRLTIDRMCVEIVGGHWSGRTAILESVRARYQQSGLALVHVHGIGDRLPLDAIRLAVAGTVRAASAASQSSAALMTRLIELKPAVILVDDADHLDEASWTVLEAVHKSTGIPLAVTARRWGRSGTSAAETTAAARLRRLPTRVTLECLDDVGVRELIEHRIGGSASPSLVGRVYTKSAGIPGFALAIMDAALEGGRIREEGNIWSDAPELWSSELDSVCEMLLSTFCSEVCEAVELLSLIGTVEFGRARSLLGQPTLELLEEHGLLAVYRAARTVWVAVCPPGLGEYFRRQPLSARSYRIGERIGAFQGLAAGARRFEHLASASAEDTGARALPFIARRFAEAFDRDVRSNRFSSGAHHAERLHLQLTTLIPNEQAVGQTPVAQRMSPEEEFELRYLRSRSELAKGSDLGTCRRALTDGLDPRFVYADAILSLSYAIGMERERIPSDYAEFLEPRVAGPGLNGAVARLVLAYAHVLTGCPEQALDVIGTHTIEPSALASEFEVVHGLALYALGRFEEAIRWSADRVERAIDALDRAALVGHSSVMLSSLSMLGRHTEAMAAGRLMLTANLAGVPALFAPDRAAMLALAALAIRFDRTSEAEGLLDRARRVPGLSEALPFGQVQMVDAARLMVHGRRVEAHNQFVTIANDLTSRGYQLAADTATLLSLAAHYDAETARPFRNRAQLVSSPLSQNYLEAWEASAYKDPDALAEVARRMRSMAANDEAVRMLLQAVSIQRARGASAKADALRTELTGWQRARYAEGGRAHDIFPPEQSLTPREHEVSRCVAEGLSNAAIGERMGISVRTVETHLRNVKRKIGVLLREDIASFGTTESTTARTQRGGA
ncbi:LuxR C-terminal-related transcriptional regulator [Plantibacter sp. Mn2098]|uniref:helix-turn-helix transcriptional regulator n=1 Tax=Plantibacter sp. Mn2098 TaxID=3395266 RepID=UPI003BCFCFFD